MENLKNNKDIYNDLWIFHMDYKKLYQDAVNFQCIQLLTALYISQQ